MKTTYTAHTLIHASAATVWDAITADSFVKDFLPEVQRDNSAKSEYIQATQRNDARVLPSYAVKGQSIGWNSGAGKVIRLPRKDTPANIEAVDIRLDALEDYTKVTIEVSYDPDFGNRFFATRRCLRGIFNSKLTVLKQDIESRFKHSYRAPAKNQANWLNLWGCCQSSRAA